MAQAHGYRGLNHRDLAAVVGVSSASVHHHFPTKVDLGVAVVKREWQQARTELYALSSRQPDPSTCLDLYPGLFRNDLEDGNRMSLCGYMAAEHDDLPGTVWFEVGLFSEVHVVWLVEVLLAADPDADWGATEKRGRAIFAAVSGAQLFARGRASVATFDDIIESYRDSGLFRV